MQSVPLEHPVLKTKAQGLQVPRLCVLEPLLGSPAETDGGPDNAMGAAASSASVLHPQLLSASVADIAALQVLSLATPSAGAGSFRSKNAQALLVRAPASLGRWGLA